jgi:eukaryotic-like serine/threonine-protein kinase
MADLKQHEESIFQAALELESPEERASYVREACGADPGLLRRVNSLLHAHHLAEGFLEKPLAGNRVMEAAAGMESTPSSSKTKAATPTESPGDLIGRYKLLQKIGEGGCGVVYMAEQEEPVRRRVALKIIKVGMDTRQVIARFEAERQALAMMDHPNIARVLDAGATETGRPFFVMDLVRGIRITDYCDQNKLSTDDRLTLFMQVCHAIQHAHQKGIIHRDIKPSNILVTLHGGQPVPVIIDFGIAKATERRLTDKTLFTAFEQFIGTPAYMSPEQAEMSRLDIDTRSDIYALGVLLYELLTGKTPFDPKALLQSGLEEMRRTIREKEPKRPSTCLSTMLESDLTTVAQHRHSEPVRLIHRLRGDLDWIVMKCLEKDRTRRYETANGLALDIERHLRNEPVLARPPSKVYRFRKLVRRNKVAFAAGGAVALALIIGLAVSTYLFVREREAYQRAVQAERQENALRFQAEKAQANADDQRRLAEENARRSRLNSYAADVYSAFLAFQSGNLGRAVDLLNHQVPQPGEEDLRGFEWRYLWQQAQGEELMSLPHPALVSCAVFSGRGPHLATASYDGVLRIWDLGTKRVLKAIPGFEQQFGWQYIAYSPDGKWLAGVRNQQLSVWDCSDPQIPVRYEDSGPVRVIAFTPDGTRLVGWGDKGLILYHTGTWERSVVRTKIRPGSFPSLALDGTSKLAAVAHEGERAIEVWNLEAATQVGYFHYESFTGMAFVSLAWSPHGLLGATTWGGRLLIVDGRTGQELASTLAHAGTTFGLAFARDGETLVTAGHDQLIHFWHMPPMEKTGSFQGQLKKIGTLHGHRDEIWSLAFSRDGRQLCTAGKDGTAKIWSAEPKSPPVYIKDWYAAEFSADGKSLVTLSEPSSELTLDIWDVANPGVRTMRTLPITGLTNLVRAIIGGHASALGVARGDGTVEVWNIDAGKLVKAGRVPGVSEITFSPNARMIAVGTEQGTVELWNLRTGQTSVYGQPGGGRVTALWFMAAGRYLRAHAKGQHEPSVWDLKTGAPLALPPAGMDRIAFSPDGRYFAGADTNYVIRVWDLPQLTERAVLKGHRWTIYSLVFSPDGNLLASGSGDAITHLWDTATGQERTRPLRGHLQGVSDLAFSPDGRALATGSTDGTVKVWHVPTGRELFSVAGNGPAFSSDGNALLIRTDQGARLLHVPTLGEIDAARKAELADK